MDPGEMPVYYELSWSILSTIGLITFFISIMVSGIVHLTTISAVPIVVSAACAIANGLCYYAFYAGYPTVNRIVAAAFADCSWLIQEVGLSMYSYLILVKVLQRQQKLIFLCIFWACVVIIAAARFTILAFRAQEILNDNMTLQKSINRLHMVYFIMIAVVETISAVFLLRVFSNAKRTSATLQSWTAKSLFKLLSRSAEIRLATLCPIGITRAITYSFQSSAQKATNTASQLDRFAYTLECLFPMVMIVDVLAAKLTHGRNMDSAEKSSKTKSAAAANHQNGIEIEFNVRTESSKRPYRSSMVRLASHEESRDNLTPRGSDVSATCHV